MAFTLKINGTPHDVDVDGDTPLLWVLRDVLGMTGTKFGCGQALCGACTVHVDGAETDAVLHPPPVDSTARAITAIRAIEPDAAGRGAKRGWAEVVRRHCQSGESFGGGAAGHASR